MPLTCDSHLTLFARHLRPTIQNPPLRNITKISTPACLSNTCWYWTKSKLKCPLGKIMGCFAYIKSEYCKRPDTLNSLSVPTKVMSLTIDKLHATLWPAFRAAYSPAYSSCWIYENNLTSAHFNSSLVSSPTHQSGSLIWTLCKNLNIQPTTCSSSEKEFHFLMSRTGCVFSTYHQEWNPTC